MYCVGSGHCETHQAKVAFKKPKEVDKMTGYSSPGHVMFRRIFVSSLLFSLFCFSGGTVVAQQSGELKLDLENFPEPQPQQQPQQQSQTQSSENRELKLDLDQFDKKQDGGELKLDLEKFDNNGNSAAQSNTNSRAQSPSTNISESQLDLEKFDQNSTGTSVSAPPVKQRSLLSGSGFYLFLGAAVLLFLIFLLRRRR